MKRVIKKAAYKVSELYNIGLDKHEREVVEWVLKSKNFGKKIHNQSPKRVKNIAFIVPGVEKFSGGITSILRLGTYLSEMNYNISFIDFSGQDIKEMQENAKVNLKNVKGNFLSLSKSDKNSYDIVIAGNWQAVYTLNDFEAYKIYFVQDYEPYFFKLNERYLLAKLTYELGVHIISLGKWNVQQIRRECVTDSRLDIVSFPYEPAEYNNLKDRCFDEYKNTNTIKIAVYTKEEGKRIPNILQSILENTRISLEKEGIVLEVYFFGLKKSYRTLVGKNMGKLTKEQMVQLYNQCDYGMVASMTNISLVPYEMIACGLPLIEFDAGSFNTFFEKEAAILIDYDYNTLIRKLKLMRKEPELLDSMTKCARKEIKQLSWKNTAKEFSDILNSIDIKEG